MKKCSECCHYGGSVSLFAKEAHQCKLRRVLTNGTGCELFNKDLSDSLLCINCEHFLGGGDWGLSCKEDYYTLCDALDRACNKFKKTGGK